METFFIEIELCARQKLGFSKKGLLMEKLILTKNEDREFCDKNKRTKLFLNTSQEQKIPFLPNRNDPTILVLRHLEKIRGVFPTHTSLQIRIKKKFGYKILPSAEHDVEREDETQES